ncbi:MAG TPA: hypothetical protein DDW52_25235 [Planctomycetaceae bacterium]|nr:hypothetical protein [Planctomycetaceae bacterium]
MHELELAKRELTDLASAIESVSRHCLIGRPSDFDGPSYFGGMPRLPKDFEWPVKDGYPLSFVGQLACRDIDIVPNDDGYLLFFYDNRHWGDRPSDAGHAVVTHFSESAPLYEPELPTRTVPYFFGLMNRQVKPAVYKRTPVKLTPSVSYPSIERGLIVMPSDVAEECYLEFCESVASDIQVGGYPAPVQCDTLEGECAEATGLGDDSDWVLLLQLFEIGDMLWGDAGALYWFILREDLATMRFDRVWMITQCH